MSHIDTWKEFGENPITHSAAHHLLAIHQLHETHGYARVTDVARELDITTGSASTNLKSLKQKGFVDEDENRFIRLSEEGQKLADAILARREIIQDFLTNVLGVDPHAAEVDACKTEHLLSQQTTEKMLAFAETLAASNKA